jgi:uncharacterized OsmC-like protein
VTTTQPRVPQYPAVVASGTLRASAGESTAFVHQWTDEGVTVQAAFTGAHLLHLAVAGCVLNDVHREAQAAGIAIDGVRVSTDGGFDADWSSTGVVYTVEVASDASAEDLDRLLAVVDEVAEIPRALRAGGPVHRKDPGPA